MTGRHMFSVTQDVIDAWAQLSGDRNPLHVSEDYARTTQFGGTIAHGHYTLALMEELLHAEHGPAWLTGGLLRDVRFTAPIRPGRTYTISLHGGPGRQRVEVRDSADGTLAVEGLAQVATGAGENFSLSQ